MEIKEIMKKFLASVIVVCVLFFGGYKYYRHTHPKYIPLPPREEVTITIIPGWNLKQVANYFVTNGIVSSTEDFYEYTGIPAKIYKKSFVSKTFELNGLNTLSNDIENRPTDVSFEGYLAPNTYRIFKDSSLRDVIVKLILARNDELAPFYPEQLQKTGMTVHQILTLASIVEKEAGNNEDMAMVADIFMRRLKEGMALQSCATVNYVTGKNSPGISLADKKIDSLYNTYKYPGLPPGPICNPSLDAIKAVLNPTKNNYVYFMTGDDGVMRYARMLEEHNINIGKYLN